MSETVKSRLAFFAPAGQVRPEPSASALELGIIGTVAYTKAPTAAAATIQRAIFSIDILTRVSRVVRRDAARHTIMPRQLHAWRTFRIRPPCPSSLVLRRCDMSCADVEPRK